MELEVQITSFIVSFVFGYFFSFLLNLNYQYLFGTRKWAKIIATVFFILDNTILYFILLRWINHGVMHPYFFFMIVLGFCFGNYYTKKIRKKKPASKCEK